MRPTNKARTDPTWISFWYFVSEVFVSAMNEKRQIRESAVKKREAETAMPHLVEKWAEETGEPWPPDGLHHYGFGTFWTWLQNNHHLYTQFRAVPNARYVAEMWFDKLTKQTWRN